MSVPGIVESALGDEDVAAQVPLSGGDELFVTPTRTLVYRAEGLLSDESVDEFDHDADRLLVSEGRRKSTVSYEYAVDGRKEFSVPTSRLADVLQPAIAGLLRARGVTDPDERIAQTYRFSELTLVVTSERLIKHVGGAVWDDEYESYHFDDVTGLDYEEGSVATQIVLEVDGRRQRIKTPNDEFAAIRQHLESALFAYHNVDSVGGLAPEPDEDEEDEDDRVDATDAVVSMGEGIDPLSTGGDPDDALDEEHLTDPGEASGETGADSATDAATEGDPSATADASSADDTAQSDEAVDRVPESEDPAPDADAETAGTETASTETESPDAEASETATDDDGDEETVAPDDANEGVIEEWESPPEDEDDVADERDDDEDGDGSFGGGFEPASDDAGTDLEGELADLREAVERQNELLAQQQQTIQQLVEALREREASREE